MQVDDLKFQVEEHEDEIVEVQNKFAEHKDEVQTKIAEHEDAQNQVILELNRRVLALESQQPQQGQVSEEPQQPMPTMAWPVSPIHPVRSGDASLNRSALSPIREVNCDPVLTKCQHCADLPFPEANSNASAARGQKRTQAAGGVTVSFSFFLSSLLSFFRFRSISPTIAYVIDI